MSIRTLEVGKAKEGLEKLIKEYNTLAIARWSIAQRRKLKRNPKLLYSEAPRYPKGIKEMI